VLSRFFPSDIPALRSEDVEEANGLERVEVLGVNRELGVDGVVRVFVGLDMLCLTKGFRGEVGDGCMVDRREAAVAAVALVADVLEVGASDMRFGFALRPLAFFFSSPNVAASREASEVPF
jgi:hypothetical protein